MKLNKVNLQKTNTAEVANVAKTQNQKVKNEQPKVDLSTPEDTATFTTIAEPEKKSSKLQKLATGFTSCLYPGLGQLVNGDKKSAAKHFFGCAGADLLAGVGVGLAMAVSAPVGIAVAAAACIGHSAIAIHSVVDAYKKA